MKTKSPLSVLFGLCCSVTKSSALLILLSLILSCKKEDGPADPSAAVCKKVVINENGDETEYEFDVQGRLLTLFGQPVADYYTKKNLVMKIEGVELEMNEKLIALLMIENGNGIETNLQLDKVAGETKVVSSVGFGRVAGENSITTFGFFDYDAQGNCTRYRIDVKNDDLLIQYNYTAKYTDKRSPFWQNPFQALIETQWSGGGHTNQHLTDSEEYTGVGENDSYKSTTKGKVIYSYQYDAQGRLKYIQIDTQEIREVYQKDTGETDTYPPENKQKTIYFEWAC